MSDIDTVLRKSKIAISVLKDILSKLGMDLGAIRANQLIEEIEAVQTKRKER